MAKMKPPVGKHSVRCLGPGPEHLFLSTDPRKNRVCEPCRKKMQSVSPMVRDQVSPAKE